MIKAFIISVHAMFSHGLEILLQTKSNFMVIGKENNFENGLISINLLQPDVVIIDSSDPNQPPFFEAMRILHHQPDIKVIGLNLSTNQIYVYKVEQKPVFNEQDFIKTIENL